MTFGGQLLSKNTKRMRGPKCMRIRENPSISVYHKMNAVCDNNKSRAGQAGNSLNHLYTLLIRVDGECSLRENMASASV